MGSGCFDYLCRPGRIGPVELSNRMTMAGMGTSLGTQHGSVSDKLIDYYEERARGGASLITIEETYVVPASRYGASIPCQLQLWDRNTIPAWRTLTEAIHYWGAKAAVQLNFPGPGVDPLVFPDVKAATPSIEMQPGFITPVVSREMPLHEILWLEDQFALGAICAREAGFDIVQIHGTHGDGIASFQSRFNNRRTDAYGGSFENRMRFSLNILKKIKAALGPDMAVTVRLPVDEFVPGGNDKEECIRIAQAYEAAGVDAIHLSCGTIPSLHKYVQPFYYPRVFLESYLKDMRKAIKVTLGIAGSFNDPEDAERVLRDYGFDFIDLGRSLLADPEYPKKVMEGRPEDIRRCLRCCSCVRNLLENHDSVICAVNAEVSRERRFRIAPAEKKKRVVVIGGGPAGMEAARVAAMRGHAVTLYEKSNKLGGNLIPASVPDFKVEFRWLIDWFVRQLDKLGVKVQLGKAVTPAAVIRLNPDVVIVSTGAKPPVPEDIVGADKAITAIDVLLGKAEVRKRVIVVGGGAMGCDTALHLAEKDKSIVIVARHDVAKDMDVVISRTALLERLTEHRARWVTNTRTIEIDNKGIKAIDMVSGKSISYPADTVVLALGLEPVDSLTKALKESVPEVYAIGDCVESRKVKEAIYEASAIARRI